MVTSDLLAREVKSLLSEFPMDHGASLGEIWMSIASLRDLDGLRRGYEIWRDHLPFPPGYLDQLANYEDAVRSSAGRRLRPAATVIGGSMKVATPPMVA